MAERPSPEEMKKRAQAAAQYAFMRDRPISLADFAPEEEPPGVFAPESIEGPKIYDALRQASLTPKGAPSVTAAVAEELIGGPVAQTVSKVVKAAPLVGAAAEGFGSMAGRAKEMVKGALKGKAAPTAGAEADAYFAPEALKNARKQLDDHKSRETLVYLTPEQFLRMAEPIPPNSSTHKAEGVAKALDEGSKLTDVLYLRLGEGGRVKGHDGRHRAMALMERGVQRVPVKIKSDDIVWNRQSPNPQTRSELYDYIENLPEEMVGEDGVSRIPFPFHREGPQRGQPLDMYRADASGSDVPPIRSRGPAADMQLEPTPVESVSEDLAEEVPAIDDEEYEKFMSAIFGKPPR